MAARTLADAQLNVEELHGVYNRLSFSPLGGRVVQWDVRRRELVPEKQRRGSEWLTVLKTNAAARSSSARFASSVMFPWCNRIGGRFWKTNDFEEIPVDTSTSNGRLHGLVYDRVFDVVRSKFNLVEFRVVLEPSKFYPFHVALNVIYELRSEMGSEFLDVKMRAENLDTRVAPVTMGVHPYFLCDRGQTTDDMEIRLRVSKEVHVDKALIPVRMGTVQRIHDFSRLTRIRDTQLDVAYAVPSRRGDDTLLGGEQQTTERGAEPESRRLKPFPEDEDAWTESESSGDEAPAAAGKNAAGGGHGDGDDDDSSDEGQRVLKRIEQKTIHHHMPKDTWKEGDFCAHVMSAEHQVKVRPVKNVRFVHVYIPPERKSIALEPTSGAADAFRREAEFGARHLQPGETFDMQVQFNATFI